MSDETVTIRGIVWTREENDDEVDEYFAEDKGERYRLYYDEAVKAFHLCKDSDPYWVRDFEGDLLDVLKMATIDLLQM